MNIVDTCVSEVKIIEPEVFEDDRGFFSELWNKRSFDRSLATADFVQDNYSRSRYGVLRGLHFQIGRPQGKLVRVTAGEVFDVAVDVRKGSATYGNWVGEVLSESNFRAMWVPPGFAHGFLVLSSTADFQYKCTDYYYPALERSVLWSDPSIGVEWPYMKDVDLLISKKDQDAPTLREWEAEDSR